MTNAKVIGWVVLCPACGDITEYNFDPVGCELRCSVCGEQLEIQPTKRQEGDSDGLYWQIKVRDKP